ncbi:hypothetical protein ACI3EY_14830 [Ornithinimicrobium sp. LYQ92]|uniref:hypothetical protein n=1 Tax=Serinicoccus sp. LYQ92 TaxID=3378798 RepID=UPI0038525B70
MATDVRLDDDPTESWVTIDGQVLNIAGSDLILSSTERRGTHGGQFRRALVHDTNDGLTVNFAHDYTGGVKINGASLNLKVVSQGQKSELPKAGNAGDLVLTRNVTSIEGGAVVGESFTLWLCTGSPAQTRRLNAAASWLPISTGEAVVGTSE